MSVLEIWGAEYQENDCLLIKPEDRHKLEAVCARERCLMQVPRTTPLRATHHCPPDMRAIMSMWRALMAPWPSEYMPLSPYLSTSGIAPLPTVTLRKVVCLAVGEYHRCACEMQTQNNFLAPFFASARYHRLAADWTLT